MKRKQIFMNIPLYEFSVPQKYKPKKNVLNSLLVDFTESIKVDERDIILPEFLQVLYFFIGQFAFDARRRTEDK